MDAMIAGSTGLVGSALLELLLGSNAVSRVTALVRRASHGAHPKLEQLIVDFDALESALSGRKASHVFCCLGTTMAKAGSRTAFRRVDHDYPLELARVMRRAGASSYLLVSAMGADPRSLIFYNRVKGELEDALQKLLFPTLHIARPSLLLGERQEHRRGERLAQAAMGRFSNAMVGPLAKYRPIEGRTVARALLRLSLQDERGVFFHDSDALSRLGETTEPA